MRVEMRKLQTEMIEVKNVKSEVKNSWKGLTN